MTISGLKKPIIAETAVTRKLLEHLKGAYLGVEISPTLISDVTEKILSESLSDKLVL